MIYVNAKIQVTQSERNTHLARPLGLYWPAAYGLEEDRARPHKAPHRKRARQDGRSIPRPSERAQTLSAQAFVSLSSSCAL